MTMTKKEMKEITMNLAIKATEKRFANYELYESKINGVGFVGPDVMSDSELVSIEGLLNPEGELNIIITMKYPNGYEMDYKLGRYNFEDGYGSMIDVNGNKKEYSKLHYFQKAIEKVIEVKAKKELICAGVYDMKKLKEEYDLYKKATAFNAEKIMDKLDAGDTKTLTNILNRIDDYEYFEEYNCYMSDFLGTFRRNYTSVSIQYKFTYKVFESTLKAIRNLSLDHMYKKEINMELLNAITYYSNMYDVNLRMSVEDSMLLDMLNICYNNENLNIDDLCYDLEEFIEFGKKYNMFFNIAFDGTIENINLLEQIEGQISLCDLENKKEEELSVAQEVAIRDFRELSDGTMATLLEEVGINDVRKNMHFITRVRNEVMTIAHEQGANIPDSWTELWESIKNKIDYKNIGKKVGVEEVMENKYVEKKVYGMYVRETDLIKTPNGKYGEIKEFKKNERKVYMLVDDGSKKWRIEEFLTQTIEIKRLVEETKEVVIATDEEIDMIIKSVEKEPETKKVLKCKSDLKAYRKLENCQVDYRDYVEFKEGDIIEEYYTKNTGNYFIQVNGVEYLLGFKSYFEEIGAEEEVIESKKEVRTGIKCKRDIKAYKYITHSVKDYNNDIIEFKEGDIIEGYAVRNEREYIKDIIIDGKKVEYSLGHVADFEEVEIEKEKDNNYAPAGDLSVLKKDKFVLKGKDFEVIVPTLDINYFNYREDDYEFESVTTEELEDIIFDCDIDSLKILDYDFSVKTLDSFTMLVECPELTKAVAQEECICDFKKNNEVTADTPLFKEEDLDSKIKKILQNKKSRIIGNDDIVISEEQEGNWVMKFKDVHNKWCKLLQKTNYIPYKLLMSINNTLEQDEELMEEMCEEIYTTIDKFKEKDMPALLEEKGITGSLKLYKPYLRMLKNELIQHSRDMIQKKYLEPKTFEEVLDDYGTEKILNLARQHHEEKTITGVGEEIQKLSSIVIPDAENIFKEEKENFIHHVGDIDIDSIKKLGLMDVQSARILGRYALANKFKTRYDLYTSHMIKLTNILFSLKQANEVTYLLNAPLEEIVNCVKREKEEIQVLIDELKKENYIPNPTMVQKGIFEGITLEETRHIIDKLDCVYYAEDLSTAIKDIVVNEKDAETLIIEFEDKVENIFLNAIGDKHYLGSKIAMMLGNKARLKYTPYISNKNNLILENEGKVVYSFKGIENNDIIFTFVTLDKHKEQEYKLSKKIE